MGIKEWERFKDKDGNTNAILFGTFPTADNDSEEQPEYPEWILELLPAFVSHIDRPIYSFRNLPPEFIAGLFARCSRSSKGMVDMFIRILKDIYGVAKTDSEGNITQGHDGATHDLKAGLMALAKLQASPRISKLHANFTLKGHESIAKLSDGIAVAVDMCSMLAAHHCMGTRMGIQFMERSTRFQKNFFKKPEFVHNIFKDVDINMRYEAMMRVAFATGQQVLEEIETALHKKHPWKDSPLMEQNGITEAKWSKWIRNRALDNARFCLPVSATTGFGVVGNAMGFNSMIERLSSCPSPEFQALGGLIRDAAAVVSPLLIADKAEPNYHKQRTYIADDPDLYKVRKPILDYVADTHEHLLGRPTSDPGICRIALDERHMSSDDFARMLASMIIGRALSLPIDAVYDYIASVAFREKPPRNLCYFQDAKEHPAQSSMDYCLRIIAKLQGLYVDGQLQNYRTAHLVDFLNVPGNKEIDKYEKLGRHFEFVNLTFDSTLSFGTWRDLNRHCLMSQWEWPLVPNLGYAIPADFDLLSDVVKDQYQSLFTMSVQLWEEAKKRYGTSVAQYAGLFMWNQRRMIRVNLRELDYIITLRSKYHGHHEYRYFSNLLYKELIKLWPIARHLFRVDEKNYAFGPITKAFLDAAESGAVRVPYTLKEDEPSTSKEG